MILADTDVLIDSLRGIETAVVRVTAELKSGTLATTTINAFELLSGAKRARERKKVETLLSAMRIVPLSESAARRAAGVRRNLEAKGQGIGMAWLFDGGISLFLAAAHYVHLRRADFGLWEVFIRAGNPPGLRE